MGKIGCFDLPMYDQAKDGQHKYWAVQSPYGSVRWTPLRLRSRQYYDRMPKRGAAFGASIGRGTQIVTALGTKTLASNAPASSPASEGEPWPDSKEQRQEPERRDDERGIVPQA